MNNCALRYLPSLGAHDPYALNIERFIAQEFPQLASGDTEDTMEAVMAEFLGSKQVRVGPRPNPESEVRMRDVVRRAIDQSRPIPVLIASAAVKVPIGESADVAELSALRMLAHLQTRVQRHYSPGMHFRVRLEDLTEYVLSPDVPDVGMHINQYTETMRTLVSALGYENFIILVSESDLCSPIKFVTGAQQMIPEIVDYLNATDDGVNESVVAVGEFQRLKDKYQLNWPISRPMREFFRARYRKLYPELAEDGHNVAMARYFAAMLTRKALGAVGDDQTFTGRLEIGFAGAHPDSPAVSTRVYYRTVPLSQSSNHLPFWSAKGFLKINDRGQPRISLGAWDGDYTRGQLEISNGMYRALLRADYILEG